MSGHSLEVDPVILELLAESAVLTPEQVRKVLTAKDVVVNGVNVDSAVAFTALTPEEKAKYLLYLDKKGEQKGSVVPLALVVLIEEMGGTRI